MRDIRVLWLVAITAFIVVGCAYPPRMPQETSFSRWFLKSVVGYQCSAMTCRGVES